MVILGLRIVTELTAAIIISLIILTSCSVLTRDLLGMEGEDNPIYYLFLYYYWIYKDRNTYH